jgi:serpin B
MMNRCAPAFLIVLLGWCNPEGRAMETTEPLASLVKGNSAFALDLYAQLSRQDGNRFLSPLSISTALAMTYAGAEGDTARQMAKTLHLTLTADQLHPAFHHLLAELHSRGAAPAGKLEPDLQLFAANALWAQKELPVLSDFRSRIEVNYKGGLYSVDFRNAGEEARRTINAWVAEQTKEKIQDLIKPNHISPDTLLVLTNAIYFKSLWESPFRKEDTRSEPFHLSPSVHTPVDMMSQSGRFRYLDGGSFEALELPYRGRALAMVILLPKAVDGLPALESTLRLEDLEGWLGKLSSRSVQLSVPKFKLTDEFELRGALSELGMPLAFDRTRADFAGITGTRDLAISAVVHKAFIEVDEKGTEAAAATGVVMLKMAAMIPTKPLVFRADHPFLFLICDVRTGSMLFLGRMLKP